MELSRRQIRSMLLAGTVAVPATFPELGVLTFHKGAASSQGHAGFGSSDILVVEQLLSPKLQMTRTFLARDVAAVFLPANPCAVDLRNGRWLLSDEISIIVELSHSGSPVVGIAYVREQASTLLNVEIGMTAAESVEYYPPLPDDRSVNHYRFENPASAKKSVYDCRDRVGECNDGVGECNDGVGECNGGVGECNGGVGECNGGVEGCN